MNFDDIVEREFIPSFTFKTNIYWAVTIPWALDMEEQTYSGSHSAVWLCISYLTSLEFNDWIYDLQVFFQLTNFIKSVSCFFHLSLYLSTSEEHGWNNSTHLTERIHNFYSSPLYFSTKIPTTASRGGYVSQAVTGNTSFIDRSNHKTSIAQGKRQRNKSWKRELTFDLSVKGKLKKRTEWEGEVIQDTDKKVLRLTPHSPRCIWSFGCRPYKL